MWLIGMMGSGKSVVGSRAAELLGVAFTDTDDLVEAVAGKSVARIWEDGEGAFRRFEKQVVTGLAGFDGIVATGGGVVLEAANRAVLGEGKVVWLRASVPALAERIGNSSHRPLLIGGTRIEDSLQGLLAQREALYQELAEHEVDTDEMSIDEIVQRIVALWRE